MPLMLYDAVIPMFIGMLDTTEHLLGKAEAWCEANDKYAEAVMGARLAPDMLDFAYQVRSAAVHSAKAIDGIRAGVFSPDRTEPARTFDGLRATVSDARDMLQGLTPDDLEEIGGMDMEFRIGDALVVPFTGQKFLIQFSQPNLYFHVTTAYDILRHIGVEIGKRDYLGPNWTKR